MGAAENELVYSGRPDWLLIYETIGIWTLLFYVQSTNCSSRTSQFYCSNKKFLFIAVLVLSNSPWKTAAVPALLLLVLSIKFTFEEENYGLIQLSVTERSHTLEILLY